MSLQTYPAQRIEDRIVNLRPIDLSGIDRRRLAHFAGDTPHQWRSAWLAQSTLLLLALTSLS